MTSVVSSDGTIDFYPRSPCGERLVVLHIVAGARKFLSTLSLRRATTISMVPLLLRTKFLSTLSLRRATRGGHINKARSKHFYPRSPCGERRQHSKPDSGRIRFLSTLSLRRATDTSSLMKCQVKFLSTLSLRRATVHYDNYNLHCVISIHALLAESDRPPSITPAASRNFYPRSPCGERPYLSILF